MSEHYFEEEDFTTQHTGKTLRRTLKQGAKHWQLMIGFLIFISAVSVVDSYFTFLSKQIIDEGILAEDTEALMQIIVRYGFFILVQAGLVLGFIYCAGKLGHLVQYDLRKRMFDKLQDLSLSYFDRTPVGWLMSRVTSDSQRVGDLVSWGFLDMTWAVTNIIVAIIFMMFINWQLALIIVAIIPVLVIVAVKFKQRILVEFRKVRKINSKITASFNENITGVRVVKALRREEKNLEEFQVETTEMYNAGFKAAWLSALFLPIVQIISAFGVAMVVLVGGFQYTIGGMTIGGIQAFVSYITFMLWPIQQLAMVYASMQQAVASAERIFSLLDEEPEIVDANGVAQPVSMRGDIVFDNMSFYYNADEPIISNMNLTVHEGETVALVGPTGAGKSTIVNLVARFYEPTAGSIQIAGRDYREWTLHGLQSRIGMVLQTPHLFSGTVMDNLRYGRLNATDEEVIAAAQMAGADEFISKLDKAYKTEVGEGGGLLSVGQKQLISIARAILAEPDILILDEATSSVDTLTEALIQRGMELLMAGRTSFVIAHRLSTIKRADRIIVIEGGKITENGTHAELIRARGHYYDLYTRQFREEMAQGYDTLVSAELTPLPA